MKVEVYGRSAPRHAAATPPNEVARGMTSETRAVLRERVPRIIAWLQQLDLSDA
jgi:hypothetical protein